LAPTEIGRCATAITGGPYALRAQAIGTCKRPVVGQMQGARESPTVTTVTMVTSVTSITNATGHM